MYYNGEWGRVCNKGWDVYDAQVVCTQLHFGLALAAKLKPYYGEGSGKFWLSNVNCAGTESTIEDCPHSGWGIENCHHDKDAGVKCTSSHGNF